MSLHIQKLAKELGKSQSDILKDLETNKNTTIKLYRIFWDELKIIKESATRTDLITFTKLIEEFISNLEIIPKKRISKKLGEDIDYLKIKMKKFISVYEEINRAGGYRNPQEKIKSYWVSVENSFLTILKDLTNIAKEDEEFKELIQKS